MHMENAAAPGDIRCVYNKNAASEMCQFIYGGNVVGKIFR